MVQNTTTASPVKGVAACDIKAFFRGLSVSVTKIAKGVWSVRTLGGEGAYKAPTYASWAERSYPGHRVIVEQASA